MTYPSLRAIDELLADQINPDLRKKLETLRALIVIDVTEWLIAIHEAANAGKE